MPSFFVKMIQGMTGKLNTAKNYNLEEAVEQLNLGNNNYEFIEEDKEFHRPYLDIDCKLEPNTTQEEYERRNEELKDRILQINSGFNIALATASSFDFNKISYHIHYPELYTNREGNKKFAKQEQEKYKDLKGVTVDLNVYSRNQKFRCVNSTKKGENRPFTLIQGKLEDTLIGFVPEGCKGLELPDPKEEKTKKREQVKIEKEQQKYEKEQHQKTEEEYEKIRKREEDLIMLISHLTPKRLADYGSWLLVGLVMFNAGLPCEDWDEVSRKASNYESGVCQKKWDTFKDDRDDKVGKTTILKMIEEDTPDLHRTYYPVFKLWFEERHFKVMNPFQYVRIPPHDEEDSGTLQMGCEIFSMYPNYTTIDGKPFVPQWVKDKDILTYEKLTFHPKPELCPKNSYNTFEGFEVQRMVKEEEVSLDRIFKQMRILTGNNETNYQWFVKYLAHLFQRPEKKTQIGLIFNGGQGTGKDTFWDFIGSLMGNKLYYTTSRPDEDVYGKFNFATACKLLIRIQEMSRDSFKRNATKVKSCITDPTLNYEEKGMKKLTLPSYENHIYTTNDETPIYLEADDRRMVIFTPSLDFAQNRDYFEPLIKDYENKSVKRAFYDYLMTVDLTGWTPSNKDVMTDTYKEVQLQSAPIIAKYFNEVILDSPDVELKASAEMLVNALVEKFKCSTYNRFTIGKILKPYINHKAISIQRTNTVRTMYVMNNEKMEQYLRSKGWWYSEE